MNGLASLISRALHDRPETVAADATGWRRRFTDLHYVRGAADR